MPDVQFHDSRPESLVYLDHIYHVMDLKVLLRSIIIYHIPNIILSLEGLPVSSFTIWVCRHESVPHPPAISYHRQGAYQNIFCQQTNQSQI